MTRTTPVEAMSVNPHGTFARLRTHSPVCRITLPDGSPAWLLTRYRDVRPALADARLSLNKRNGVGGWQGFSLPPTLDANLLNMDPPDHSRIRRLVSQAFTARRTEAMRARIAAVADQLLARLPAPGPGPASGTGSGAVDLVDGYAVPLPVVVICDLLGVPADERARLRGWTEAMLVPPAEDPRAAGRAVIAIERFLTGLVRAKRDDPADDLLTAMIAARDAADRLSEDELTSLAFLILFAGYENSVHLIGNCLLRLLSEPELRDRVVRDPALAGRAVEETLRMEPPATLAIRRFAVRDVEFDGTVIPAGDTVLLGVAAANRDPEVFPEPDRFRLDRPENPHLGLGYGPHYCLGAALGRLEAEVAVTRFLRRYPDAALAVPADRLSWRPSIRSRALRSLSVTTRFPAGG